MLQRLALALACTLILGLAWPALPAGESPPPAGPKRIAPPVAGTTSASAYNALPIQATPPIIGAVQKAGPPTQEAPDPAAFLVSDGEPFCTGCHRQ